MAGTLNDGVMSKLTAFTGTSNDKQRAWLRSVITPTPAANSTLNDLWGKYCTQEGVVSGTVQERIKALMANAILAPAGSTYNDIQRAYWNAP